MSKIKLIVEIDEEYFHMIQKEGGKNYPECAILHGTPLDDLKKEIDKESVMHMDGEIYIRNIDVKRILGKTETR